MYDDYMQNLLREDYSPYQYTYKPITNNSYYNYINNCSPKNLSRNLVTDIESLYPDIYKLIYPMIKKALSQNTQPITEDILDEIAKELYNNIETENNLNINITNNRNENKSLPNSKNTIYDSKETRHINNSIRDLIKILLIRELIDRPDFNVPPSKPYFQRDMSLYPRPPMPGHHSHITNSRY